MGNVSKLEIADMFDVVSKDLARWSNADRDTADTLGFALMCAAWQLRGEPSFVERNDALKAKYP